MIDPGGALTHTDATKKDDETLKKEARDRLSNAPAVQLVAELLTELRARALPWWAPEPLRVRWPASVRMHWYAQRPDLRQGITTKLTGLAANAARKKSPEFQAELVDSVIDDGDIRVADFDNAFDPSDLAVYGPAGEIWTEFVERMPWPDGAPAHQELVAWLIEAMLTADSRLTATKRKPILTPWQARTAIDGRVWHTHLPVEVRVAIDQARFDRERDRASQPFLAVDDLAIAKPAILAKSIPLAELRPVVLAAGRAMGFEAPAARAEAAAEAGPKTEDSADKRARRATTKLGMAKGSPSEAPPEDDWSHEPSKTA